MIKLLLSGKQLLLFIIIAWSLLAFVSYNVLSVQASEKDDKKVCESYNGEWKKTADSGGERWCNIDNEQDLQRYSIRSGDSLDGTGSDAELGREDMGPEATAAIEDDICDDEDADSTNIPECMSDNRKQDENIEKTCDKVDGKMTKEGFCDTDGSGDTPKADRFNEELMALEQEQKQNEDEPEVIEDSGNTVTASDEEQEKINAEAQYQHDKYEQLTKPSPEYDVEELKEAVGESDSVDEEEVADNNEEDDNQVNTDTEDSSDNTDSLDGQDSSDSEDNSSDDGDDSSDSGDDSSSSDDGGDSGDSSESEE